MLSTRFPERLVRIAIALMLSVVGARLSSWPARGTR